MLETVWNSLKRFRRFKLFAIFSVYAVLFVGTFILYREFGQVDSFDDSLFEKKDFAEFEQQVKKIGARKSYELLKKRFPGNDPDAHDFAHTIGYVAFYEKGERGISICDTFFNYGCYHGFMIKFFQENGVGQIKKMESACDSLGAASSPSCLHGIGHGLMMEAGYNLAKALVNCDPLQESAKPYCWDGVFMERIAGSMQEPQDRFKPTEETLDEPCVDIDAQYGRECWRNQVAVWFNYYNQDGLRVGSRCVVAEAQFRDVCYESVGLKVAQVYGDNEQRLVEMCKFVNAGAYSRCIIGVMRELMFEGKNVEFAKRMCELVDVTVKDECFSNYSRSFEEYSQRFKDAV